jgi:hypothetical protein
MQATTCFHDDVPYPVLQKAELVLHEPVAFHPTNGVFHTDSDGGKTAIRRLLRGCEFPSTRCFLGLDDGDVLQVEPLEAPILIQAAARWQGIASALCHALIRSCASIGVAQEAYVTGLVDHEEVVARGTLLLAAVICLWLFGIGRAVDRPCSAIMPTRGVVDLPSVACGLNIAAHAAAVRAGSHSWAATACFNTRCRR